MLKKYIVVGGNPIRSYTQTLTFTGLTVVGHADSKEELATLVREQYDACGGLLLVIDSATGLPATDLD